MHLFVVNDVVARDTIILRSVMEDINWRMEKVIVVSTLPFFEMSKLMKHFKILHRDAQLT